MPITSSPRPHMPFTKMFALASVAGAAFADLGLFVYAAMQSASPPSIGDIGVAGGVGAGTTIAILWFWKGTVDKRMDRLDDTKADKASIADIKESINVIREDVRWLVRTKEEEQK